MLKLLFLNNMAALSFNMHLNLTEIYCQTVLTDHLNNNFYLTVFRKAW